MSYAIPEVLFAVASMTIGWLTLWPLRRGLGRVGYHVAALPTGLIAWSLGAAVGSLAGRPFDALTALMGAVVLVVAVWITAYLVRDEVGTSSAHRSDGEIVGFAVTGSILLFTSFAFGLSRLSTTSGDAYRAFWPVGVELSLQGSFSTYLVASRSVLIPAMNAAHILFGSDWAYVIYPLLTLNLMIVLALLLLSGPLRDLGRTGKVAVVAGLLVFLLSDPTFTYHALYTHSHMISALYLLLSLGAMWMATREARIGVTTTNAWLVVSGMSAAGLALTRPDGLAYVFVPVALAVSLLTRREHGRRSTVAFFAPLLFIVYLSYLPAFVGLGLWSGRKLDGLTALGILVMLGVASIYPLVFSGGRNLPARLGAERLLSLIVLAGWSLVVLSAILRWETVSLAWTHAAMNLFGGHGDWGWVWYSVAGLLGLSVLSGDALRNSSWTKSLFLSVMLFFAVAALVHGTSHPGRLGANDSFNRVAFHVLPVVLWYAGCVLGSIVGETARTRRSSELLHPESVTR